MFHFLSNNLEFTPIGISVFVSSQLKFNGRNGQGKKGIRSLQLTVTLQIVTQRGTVG
jgi:hypothetical protein